MGRMDVTKMRYMQGEHFRVLIAVEMGMKNHEMVPLALVASVAGIHRGAVSRTLSDLCKHSLVAYERGNKYDGYRLTIRGYDYLALRALCSREVVGSVGNQIGVGKESDVYVGGDPDLNDLCLKFHRLGRTSFRKIKEKRDYHNKRKSASWLYLSRIAAAKEFAFLKALAERNFPVPRPVDVCRHLVVMGLVDGTTLCHVDHLDDPAALYDRLMALIVKLARHGLIHGDFNEFNLMLLKDEKVIMIDFPQMVSMDHENAKFYFERDVECVRTIFRRKFDFDSDDYPRFEEMERKYCMDVELNASGFTKQMQLDLNKAYDAGKFDAHDEGSEEDEDSNSDESDADGERIEEANEDDIDAEEMRIEKEQKDKEAKLLGRSERFNAWLGEATHQLEQTVLEEEGECPLLVHPNDVHRLEEIRQERDAYIKAREEAEREEAELAEAGAAIGDDDIEGEAADVVQLPKKKMKSAGSVASTTTTIPPDEIKRRVAMQSKKNTQRTKLKVKGKQSAVNRGRKDNRATIGECSVWDF